MKRMLILIFLLLLPNVLFAQDTTWTTIEGVFNPTYYDESRDVCVLSDGSGYVIVGYLYQATNENIAAIKYDTTGTRVWSKVYKGSAGGSDRGYGICEGEDGNLAIAGYVTDGGGQENAIILTIAASDGDSLNSATFGANGFEDIARGIVSVPSDSGFIICGTTASYLGNNNEFMVARYDSNLDTVWTKHWIPGSGNNAYDHFQTLALTSDGNIILGGYTRSEIWNGGISASNIKNVRGLIAKIELVDGDSLWFRHYDNYNFYSEVYQVRELSDSTGYIACGGEMKFQPASYDGPRQRIRHRRTGTVPTGSTPWPRTGTHRYMHGSTTMS